MLTKAKIAGMLPAMALAIAARTPAVWSMAVSTRISPRRSPHDVPKNGRLAITKLLLIAIALPSSSTVFAAGRPEAARTCTCIEKTLMQNAEDGWDYNPVSYVCHRHEQSTKSPGPCPDWAPLPAKRPGRD
jgi:hypothetical protein